MHVYMELNIGFVSMFLAIHTFLRVIEQPTVGFVRSVLQGMHACLRAVEQLTVGFVMFGL